MRGDRPLLAQGVDRRWSRGRRLRRGKRVRDSGRELTQGISLRLTRRNPPQCRSPAQPDRPRGEIPRRVSAGGVRRVCARGLNVSPRRVVRRQRALVTRASGAPVVIVTLRSRADASAFSRKIVALCAALPRWIKRATAGVAAVERVSVRCRRPAVGDHQPNSR